MMNERRVSPRAELTVIVNQSINARAPIKNISDNGICLLAETEFNRGDILSIVFNLPVRKEIRAYTKVIWSRKVESSLYENGLQFWYIDEEDRQFISHLVHEHMKCPPGS
ncbi:MAG: PilZ domain-containing protein [Spirochaetales bacterium]|nr:PilZ domain-containing protein [Spirochaetales bacterium]